MKIRVMQSDVFVDMMTAPGANATPMPYCDVCSAIQTGVIDGAENNSPSSESAGQYEVAGYCALIQHLIAPEVLVMSKISFDRLHPADEPPLVAAAKASIAVKRKLWAALGTLSEEKMRAWGAEIISDIDETPFIEAMVPVYP